MRMTKLLEKAFTEASKLPEQDQDALAYWLLEEMDSERKWDEAFARSGRLGPGRLYVLTPSLPS